MPVFNPKPPPVTTKPEPPASTVGAWTHDPQTGKWTWIPGAKPDPKLAESWGNGPMTDIRQDPTGVPNPDAGAWTKAPHGGWQWIWGAKPDPNLTRIYGTDALKNRDRTPDGTDTRDANTPPPPDVTPPVLKDNWYPSPGAPDVTGDVPDLTGGLGRRQATEPPPHPAFVVSPGTIRLVEVALGQAIHTKVDEYNSLKDYVAMSHGQNLYGDGGIGRRDRMIATQNRLLLAVADVVTLAGQFNQMLNYAAQSYAKADRDSFVPPSDPPTPPNRRLPRW